MLTPFGRKIKQTNVFFGWIIFLIVVVGFICFLVARPQTVGEIRSLEIKDIQAELKSKEKIWQPPFTYTLTASVINPNEEFSANKVNYIFKVLDDAQRVIAEKKGTIEILPKQNKKVQEEVTINNEGKNFNFKLTGSKWERAVADMINE
ncbi:MAG: hypothetical protein O2U61_04720 [Candidatus Bathyarchaeota archaeon]|nr:hypothetical protein [Candidatus Bathyarchaeota archaeon]